MSLNDFDRVSNLWKKSRGVNDVRKGSSYVNPAQTAFKENIFNNAIFSQQVPDELPGNLISSIIGTIHPESVEYLDYKFNSVGVDPGQIPGIPGPNTPQLGPNFGTRLTSVPQLTYYHRIQLFPNNNADDTSPVGVTKSTWYLPDPSNNKLSLLRDTINFKTGTRGDYVYKMYSALGGLVAGQPATPIQEVTDPYSIVFDNRNGLLYLYGDDSANNWTIGAAEEIYISFIRYEGLKGAAGGSGGITPGSDVSFNNVDISQNLNVVNLKVTGDASFNNVDISQNLTVADVIVTGDTDINGFLTVNGDGFIQSFEATNFDATGSTRPFLAEISAQISNTILGPFTGIKNIIGHATFEIIASNDNPDDKTSSRNQVIIGTILVTGSCKDGTSSYNDITGSINIIHSSWCGSTSPLISRVFFKGLAQATSNFNTLGCKFFIESSSTIPYLQFKLKNNNKNDKSIVETTGLFPLPSQGTFHTHWNINSSLITFPISPGNPSQPNTLLNTSITIPSDKKSYSSLAAEEVNIPNLVSSNLEIGDSNSNISFKAHQFSLNNVNNGDWFTIAKLGTNNTISQAQNRGVAIIEIYNRQSSRHQCVRMSVSQIFKFGGSIEAYNVGYNTGGIQYQKVRIVSDNTYDGALLQVHAGPGILTGLANIHYVNLMLSTNEPGWQIIDDESVVNADNTPTKYSGPTTGQAYTEPSQGWTEISLESNYGYTSTQSGGPRAFTGKVTTLPTTFQGARLQVRGEYITAYRENGFGGNIGSVDGVVTVQDAVGNNDITLSLDSNGDGKIGNTNSSNGKNITLESDNQITLAGNGDINILSTGTGSSGRNIILDNTTGSQFPFTGDIIGKARGNIEFLCENRTNNNKISFETWGISSNNGIQFTQFQSPNPSSASAPNATEYTMKWSADNGGLSVGTHNIIDVKNILGDESRTQPMLFQADDRWATTSTRASSKSINCNSPFKIIDAGSQDITNSLNNNSAGTMLFDYFLSSIVLKPGSQNIAQSGTDPVIAGTATEITLWDKLTKFSTPNKDWVATDFNSNPPVSLTYTKGNVSMRNFSWPMEEVSTPINLNPNSGTSFAFEFYKAPFDGYIVAVDFGGTVGHQATNPAFSIKRTQGFNIAGSRLILEAGVGGFGSSGTTTEIGTILTGPEYTATGTVSTNDMRWQFTINPSQNKISFRKGQSVDFRIKFELGLANDQFRAIWTDLTTNGTIVNLNLNLVYNIPH